MQRRTLAVFALMLAVVVGVFVWRAARDDGRAELASERTASAPPVDVAPPRTELAAPKATVAPEPTSTSAVESSTPEPTRAVAAPDAVEFTLDVTWPADVPADEQAFLVVQGKKTSDVVERLPLARGGRYALHLPKEHTKGRVVVEARYLYLERTPRLDPDEHAKPLACEPKVGAWVTGRVQFPASLDDGDIDFTKAQMYCQRKRVTRSGNSTSTSLLGAETVPLTRDGRYEFGGLSSELEHALIVDLPVCARYEHELGALEAGRKVERDIELALGASFFGRVVDERGEPISKATVGCAVEESYGTHLAERTAQTAADGTFALRGVAPERMRLHVARDGFADWSGELEQFGEGAVDRDLLITLSQGGVIAGVVRWPDGRPAAGAAIQVEEPERSERRLGPRGDDDAPAAKSDTGGAFTVSGLGAGPFDVRATSIEVLQGEGKKKERRPWSVALASVEAGRRDLVLVLEPPLALVGTVRDDLGRPVARATITASPIDADGRPNWDAKVTAELRDPSGEFRVEKVHPGKWHVTADGPDVVDSVGREVVVGDGAVATVELVCPRAVKLSGIVLDPDGNPLAEARLDIDVDARGASWSDNGCASTKDGTFACAQQRPGEVTLRASHPKFAVSEALQFTLAPGDVREGLELRMRRGGSVEVEVLASAGARRDGHDVHLALAGSHEFAVGSVETDAEGLARFPSVPPGSYEVNVRRDGGAGGHDQAQVEVVEGRTARVVVGDPNALAIRVHGRVVSGERPVARAEVRFTRGTRADDWDHRAVRSDDEGAYEVVLDEAGPWEARVEAGGGSVEEELVVPAAAQFAHDFVLGTASIEGTVLDPEGEPAVDIWLSISPDGGEHAGSAHSDVRGRFRFANLAAGSYRVTSVSDGGEKGYARTRSNVIELANGQQSSGLVLRLARGASLEVRVRGERGDGDLWVEVTELDKQPIDSEEVPDATDRVTIRRLPAGRVRVLAWGGSVRSAWTEVEVVAGETRTLELELVAQATATIRIVDASGTPIPARIAWMKPGSDGSLTFDGEARTEHVVKRLMPGPHRVLALADSGAKGELALELAPGETKSFDLVVAP